MPKCVALKNGVCGLFAKNTTLFERTVISKKPEELAKSELQQLKDDDKLSPDLVFRYPYVLDFLNFKDTYQEKDFEKAILKELEQFILELGKGFTFVERQKRMIIDNEYFYTVHRYNLRFCP
jgi:predicted nuclease of restriction endonuclease-like (RecB) superfamily